MTSVGAGAGTPSRTRHTSVLVPPMSNDTASRKPHASATTAAARTPATGPDSSNEAGRRTASSSGTRPPADVITRTSSRERREPEEVRAADRSQRGVGHGRDHAVRTRGTPATPRGSTRRRVPSPRAPPRPRVRAPDRDRRGADRPRPRRRRRSSGTTRRTARPRHPTRRVARTPRTASARGTSGRRSVDVLVVERRPRLPRDLDHVGEASGRDERDAADLALEQRVGRHRRAVRQELGRVVR